MVTNEQIEALEIEAGEAGDAAQVELCRAALDGNEVARAKCERAIADAQAQAE